ncbi:similar to predicted CDS, mechanosensory transduction channel NOMPC (1O503) (predicted) [Rattus norvegicus]|uniref:Similar to predicted CDS, mechanosensory transduction channel NOMPC (1O503) (Predicted) n=1 Tax=Rattus norvegicus TaxID=10116 RepID=A6JJ37_RAT|nr:similar to predicted CDS, mechanosensory transduction channel NOMPC (1O503) (predicted) [Rattus norvegicus]
MSPCLNWMPRSVTQSETRSCLHFVSVAYCVSMACPSLNTPSYRTFKIKELF